MKFREFAVAGTLVGMIATALSVPIIDRHLHSKSIKVDTSIGQATVRDWQTSKGIEVWCGGFTTLYDWNKDGKLDYKTGGVMGRLGVYRWHEQATKTDQKFYDEVIFKSGLILDSSY